MQNEELKIKNKKARMNFIYSAIKNPEQSRGLKLHILFNLIKNQY